MNSAAPWTVDVDERVEKKLRRFPKKDAERILSAFTAMVTNPYSGDIIKMKGEKDVWRRRIGAYRFLFEVLAEERAVYIFRVERRTSTTY